MEAWDDAARMADRKWDKIMGEVWPTAREHVARELGTDRSDDIVFAANTHDFIVRLAAACPRSGARLRCITSDGEFHSARRQFARWSEEGWFAQDKVAAEPYDEFGERFLERALSGDHDLIFISQVMFGSGRIFDQVRELAGLARPEGPWVVIDGYHAFMALEAPFAGPVSDHAFYLGGGYKYAMAGEGCAFLHAPTGYGPRPPLTGWFAEFEDLSLAPGQVGYAPDAMRFMGATFDPSSLYRFNAVQAMLIENGLTTPRQFAHASQLQQRLLDRLSATPLASFALLNPLGSGPHARFLAFRGERAADVYERLLRRDCVTDVRGGVLRLGFGLYQDEDDVDRLIDLLGDLD
jgi:selenocysteine lyase/cysteine desulfurase